MVRAQLREVERGGGQPYLKVVLLVHFECKGGVEGVLFEEEEPVPKARIGMAVPCGAHQETSWDFK